MLIKRFEEMKVWQDARVLTKNIYDVSSVGKFFKDFGLRDQIQRASVSICQTLLKVMSGIAIKSLSNFLDIQKDLLVK